MIVFCIPWIVEVFMSLMDSVGFSVNYQECLSNAKSGDFSYFDSLLEKEEKNDNTTTNNKITYENAGTKVIASGLITVSIIIVTIKTLLQNLTFLIARFIPG